jgi:trimeric autotransporter adhesin
MRNMVLAAGLSTVMCAPQAVAQQLPPGTIFEAQQKVDVSTIQFTDEGNLRFGIAGAGIARFPDELVNLSQLTGGLQNVESRLNGRINEIRSGANQGVAAAAAMMTTARTPDPGKSTISVGGGYYGGQAASAVSMAHRSRSGKLQAVASVGVPVSMVSGSNIAAAGAIGWQF